MIPQWFLLLPLNLITETSRGHLMNPYLVAAIIQQESRGRACATRYEPRWKYFLKIENFSSLNKITFETEKREQQTSWGAMQVMGSVARELGHSGPLVELCDFKNGIELGVKKLAELKNKHHTMDKIIASYNAGSPRFKDNGEFVNQEYVDSVKSYYDELNL